MQKETEAYSLGILAVAAFAMTLPATKLLTDSLSAFQIGIFRCLLAAFAAVPLLLVLRVTMPNKAQLKQLFKMSVGIIYGFPILTAFGMQYLPASHGSVILATLPIITAIAGSLITNTRPSNTFWCICVTGLLVVSGFSVYQNGLNGVYWGDLALLAAAFFAGYGYACGGALSQELPGWQVMCWALVINLPILLCLGLLLYDHSQIVALDPTQINALLFLAFVNSLLGFFAWNKALALGGIQKVSQIQLLQPFMTIFFAAIFLGEHIDFYTYMSCSIVIVLVWAAKRA